MRGTDLQEIIEMTLTGNIVTHIPTGNVVARAISGILLVDYLFHTLLLSGLWGSSGFFSNDNIPLELETMMISAPEKSRLMV